MGSCCVATSMFYEIEEASSINELNLILKEKKKEIPIEINEIEIYIQDKQKLPKKIDVGLLSDNSLNKRINYLKKYEKELDKVIEILELNPNMNYYKTKPIINDLYQSYFVLYDENKQFNAITNKLNEIVR